MKRKTTTIRLSQKTNEMVKEILQEEEYSFSVLVAEMIKQKYKQINNK